MTPDRPDLLLAFDDEAALAVRLAGALGCELAAVALHRFPDGEIKLALPERLPARVAVLRGLAQPNDRLVALQFVAAAARRRGAHRLALVAPYLAYMRQDTAFAPGEVVSQREVAAWLGGLFDTLVTVDPHLHRIASLDAVLPPTCSGRVVSAAPLLGAWASQARERPVLVGPDEESAPWVQAAARGAGLDVLVGRKRRRGDRDVVIELPGTSLAGRATVLVDDIASTGRTLAQAARALRAAGAASVDVAVAHALFVGDALDVLRQAGIERIASSDTVVHATNSVSVAELLAAALCRDD